jgi:hypothetical protein
MPTPDDMIKQWARDALAVLVTDEPLPKRLHEALRCLRRLRSMPEYDPTIIEMLNDAGDSNLALKEKAQAVAQVIETVFRLPYPPGTSAGRSEGR